VFRKCSKNVFKTSKVFKKGVQHPFLNTFWTPFSNTFWTPFSNTLKYLNIFWTPFLNTAEVLNTFWIPFLNTFCTLFNTSKFLNTFWSLLWTLFEHYLITSLDTFRTLFDHFFEHFLNTWKFLNTFWTHLLAIFEHFNIIVHFTQINSIVHFRIILKQFRLIFEHFWTPAVIAICSLTLLGTWRRPEAETGRVLNVSLRVVANFP